MQPACMHHNVDNVCYHGSESREAVVCMATPALPNPCAQGTRLRLASTASAAIEVLNDYWHLNKTDHLHCQGWAFSTGPCWASGRVSTNNSGGFASVRCRNFEPPLDLGAFEGVELRLKGNGLRYKCILRPDANWDGIAYCYSFDTQPGTWQTIRIPFTAFIPVFRARTLKEGAALNAATISSVQIMLSKFEYDGELNPAFKAGEFELPISRIAAYLPDHVGPRFVHVSSAGAGQQGDSSAEEVVRASGVPAVIIRPGALTDEPRGMPLVIKQGDTRKEGKLGSADLAELCCAVLSQPATLDTTFEVVSSLSVSEPWQVDPASPPAPRDWAAEVQAAKLVPDSAASRAKAQV